MYNVNIFCIANNNNQSEERNCGTIGFLIINGCYCLLTKTILF